MSPVEVAAAALSPTKAKFLKCLDWVEFIWICLELGPCQSFDFLFVNQPVSQMRHKKLTLVVRQVTVSEASTIDSVSKLKC